MIQFVDFVPEPEWRHRWGDTVNELRDRPGCWAETVSGWQSERAYDAARYLRKKYGLLVKVRKQSDGSGWTVYAMAPE